MTATIAGDYSKYPISIREVFPHVTGEACELRDWWEVYSHLFMEKEDLTEAMDERLGGVLRIFQSLLQDEMFLTITRLTDKDSRAQKNLTLWRLLDSIPDARDAGFGDKVRSSLEQIYKAAASIRTHRHKRIGHSGLSESLGTEILPIVTFNEIRGVLEQIEEFLNLFCWEFENMTLLFTGSPLEITGQAEETIYKAHAYDLLEAEGAIPKLEWRRRAEELKKPNQSIPPAESRPEG
jgi:hypothetical protein